MVLHRNLKGATGIPKQSHEFVASTRPPPSCLLSLSAFACFDVSAHQRGFWLTKHFCGTCSIYSHTSKN